jgi:hypothetical protein
MFIEYLSNLLLSYFKHFLRCSGPVTGSCGFLGWCVLNFFFFPFCRGLAIHLELISPESPLLSAEDRQDLALLDQLMQSQSRLQQVLGLETEIVVKEKWNFDAVVQLLDLANNISDIPFASGTELLALEPSLAAESGPPGMSSKGKGRQEEEHKTRSNDKPYVAGSEWADSIGELCLSLGLMQLLTPGKSIRYLRCRSALTSKISIVFFL